MVRLRFYFSWIDIGVGMLKYLKKNCTLNLNESVIDSGVLFYGLYLYIINFIFALLLTFVIIFIFHHTLAVGYFNCFLCKWCVCQSVDFLVVTK